MPAYNQHVVICTGKDDWPSRIEDGKTPGFFGQPDLAHFLKSLLGPMGSLHDVSQAEERCRDNAGY